MHLIVLLFVYCFVGPPQYINARTDNNDYYIGAVVEYASVYDAKNSPQKIMEINLANYIDYIKEAKQQNADIIVFPECGLTSIRIPNKPAEAIKYTSLVPNPKDKVVPCNPKGTATILERISCEAKENNIYIVVNLPERYGNPNKKDEFLLYNTNVVFDRNGAVIARYRKYNLFGEPAFNKTASPELITFDTDFGVTFGTFICFDILFAEPAMKLLRETKATDIVYPTAWFSSLPFLTAIQVQAGWARANQVNLLAAGYDNPAGYSGGSGIFSGTNGISDYLIPTDKSSHLLVSRINKIKAKQYNDIQKTTQCKTTLSSANYLHTMQENFSNYTTTVLKGDVSNNELCHGTFCCKFTAKFNKQDTTVTHMMVAYRGLRRFTIEWNTVEICGIVTCANVKTE
ncbi:uncharacterized protein CBL_08810 [Carabus blaptoides fortunei]